MAQVLSRQPEAKTGLFALPLCRPFFEGKIEISRTENGASFGLSSDTYLRMAQMSMTAAGMKIEPSVICRLPNGERGCKLVLYGSKHQFTLRVRVLWSCATIAIFAQPLDGLRCVVPVYEGEDCERSWSRGLRAMLEFERKDDGRRLAAGALQSQI